LFDEFSMIEGYINLEDREKMISILKKDSEINNLEIPFKRKDGSLLWIRYSAKIVPDKNWIE